MRRCTNFHDGKLIIFCRPDLRELEEQLHALGADKVITNEELTNREFRQLLQGACKQRASTPRVEAYPEIDSVSSVHSANAELRRR